MWRITCSWIDRPSGGPFQYKTLSSTRRITHSGTEGFHISEKARVVNVLRLLLLSIMRRNIHIYVYVPQNVVVDTYTKYHTRKGLAKSCVAFQPIYPYHVIFNGTTTFSGTGTL